MPSGGRCGALRRRRGPGVDAGRGRRPAPADPSPAGAGSGGGADDTTPGLGERSRDPEGGRGVIDARVAVGHRGLSVQDATRLVAETGLHSDDGRARSEETRIAWAAGQVNAEQAVLIAKTVDRLGVNVQQPPPTASRLILSSMRGPCPMSSFSRSAGTRWRWWTRTVLTPLWRRSLSRRRNGHGGCVS